MATARAMKIEKLGTRARSLEIVGQRGYFGWGPACTVATVLDASGQRLISLTVRVPSASRADVWHVLTYDAAADDAMCDCRSAAHGGPCFHRGCAVNAGRYVARLARLGWPED